MSEVSESPNGRMLPGPALTGLLLLMVYALYGSAYGFSVRFGGSPRLSARHLEYISRGEYRFWTAHLLLAVPGMLALGYGLAPRLGPWLRRVVQRWERSEPREWRVLGLLYFALLLLIYRAGNELLLLGHMITDDEHAVRFGGRIIANGDLMVPIPQPQGAFTTLYTMTRDGMMTSMEFPGLVFVAALAELTNTGALVYGLLAAATGLAVAATAGQLVGRRGAFTAALIWLVSPMAFSLSLTSHGHVVSRAFIALAFLCHAHVATRAERDRGVAVPALLLGFTVALAFMSRAYETPFIMAPTAIFMALQVARRSPRATQAFVCALIGTLPPLMLFAWYNAEVTGNALTPPRLSDAIDAAPFQFNTSTTRIGSNLGHNLLLLAIFFFGPFGLPLAWYGCRKPGSTTMLMAAGLLFVLLLALIHDNVGIHTVGPIHYSEAAVMLTVLAALGLLRLFDRLRELHFAVWRPAALAFCYAAGAMGLFVVTYSESLRRHGEFSNLLDAHLDQEGVHHAVVLAPQPAFWDSVLPGTAGSWQLQLPHPDPYDRADRIYARLEADVAALREHYPQRRIVRLRLDPERKVIAVEDLTHAPSAHASSASQDAHGQ